MPRLMVCQRVPGKGAIMDVEDTYCMMELSQMKAVFTGANVVSSNPS